MTTSFDNYVGIDYSGAGKGNAPQSGIRVFVAKPGGEECRPVGNPSPRRKNWGREDLTEWLIDLVRRDERSLIGLDHAFSYPERVLCGTRWRPFLRSFAGLDSAEAAARKHKGWKTDEPVERYRLTDMWSSSARSIFDWRPNGVAHSTHAGLIQLAEILARVEERVFVWPLQGTKPQADRSVIVEAYPALYKRRYPLYRRPDQPEKTTPHEQDAYATARWLREQDERGNLEAYFALETLTKPEQIRISSEGWILGVL